MLTAVPAQIATDIHKDLSATSPLTFQHAVQLVKKGQPLSHVVQALLSELTKIERLSLLDGDETFYKGLRKILCDRYNREPFVHGAVARLNIPGIQFSDGPRGVVMGSSTAFPVPMARGATWDLSLERRIGDAIGMEAKAQGANYFAGVCINLPRHPAWGRIQETYGEDPIILGEFGLALTQGVQRHIMACVKHFALNSMENARFRVDVKVGEDVLHEVYLAHFRRVIEGGVASVMSSYNSVNGEWAGQNRMLLTEILRKQYKFEGFTLSDFIFGLRDAALSVKHGLDIEAPFTQQRGQYLTQALDSGELEWSDVNIACSRILTKQLEFAVFTEASQPDPSVVFCAQHRALAREAAARSMVLLKNECIGSKQILPLRDGVLSRVAVVGRLANTPNTGDRGSSQVFPPSVVTPFQGIQAALPHATVVLEDSDSVEAARKVASQADVVICVVGYDATDEGEYVVPSLQHDPCLLDLFPPASTQSEKETLAIIQGSASNDRAESGLEVGAGGDRNSLRLRARDVELINAVTAANPNTVVSLITAGAVIMEEWKSKVPAILISWYSGCEGGHALADVLLGRIDASGRLPFSIPQDESHLPFFDADAEEIKYDRWFGQNLLDKMGVEAAFPMGFGLSYTSFSVAGLRLDASEVNTDQDIITVHVNITNIGVRYGRHIAQVYGLVRLPDFPSRVLLGFATADLNPGETQHIVVNASIRPLQRWINGKFERPGKKIIIEVASYAGDPHALGRTCLL